jgi:hypothetical protein
MCSRVAVPGSPHCGWRRPTDWLAQRAIRRIVAGTLRVSFAGQDEAMNAELFTGKGLDRFF